MGKLIKFDHVNAHGDFEKLLSQYGIDYSKKGAQLRALCPLHEDTNPSLSVALEAEGDTLANTFHCFGCHQSGSIIDFAAHLDGGTLREAAEIVAELSGCGLAPAKTPKPAKASKRPAKDAKGSKREKPRPQTDKAAEGHSAPSERASEAKQSNQPLKFELKLDGAHPYALERVGQWGWFQFGIGVLDAASRSMMAGRCCVPIHNAEGDLIAYAGRHIGEDPDAQKWLLPPGFQKQQTLFNLHRVAGAEQVVLVEGFFDVVRLAQFGIPAVACMGTAVSDTQVALLKAANVRRVVLAFDGDDEGQAAVPAALSVLTRSLFTRLGALPVGEDPGSADEMVLRQLIA
ncbi:CHC2 zinc finger domain-containing protein [Sulfitobacter aestuariivivens]|uniref:Toprim domain-containing protein n=1 Tax=Sulfitobacter aestuariivivens TaxID=2766981 RepID=A0A927HEV8_9RHOB|nr:CHC2 zinc finger domain-containing protein [Sulfitobacter aestuariivivens]MBD3663789.1 toprim domain-containing protein [Sulfitobacter aestuariivivens]